jgi:hypothetical protein
MVGVVRRRYRVIISAMSSTAIICGVFLILIGLVGYGYGLNIGHASPTALIPIGFGAVLAILGLIGRVNESLRKHLMHVAVIVALLGLIGAVYSLFRNGMPTELLGAGPLSQIAMALVCLLFVVLAVRSFIEARRDRTAI